MVEPQPAHPRRGVSRRRAGSSGERQIGVALEACYRLLLWLVPVLEKFPRSQKFLLADRMQTQALNVLDHLIAATYVPQARTVHLQAANLALEHLRFGLRLAHDLHHLDMPRYQYAAEQVDEVGRLVGGWLRSAQPAPDGPQVLGKVDHGAQADPLV